MTEDSKIIITAHCGYNMGGKLQKDLENDIKKLLSGYQITLDKIEAQNWVLFD